MNGQAVDQPLYDSKVRWESLGRRRNLRRHGVDPDQPVVEERTSTEVEESSELRAAE